MSTPPDFGAKLREARERRGVTLRQISNSTKISMGALEALERNDISRLPGGIFTRAFVRSYATEVGLDPEQTIREFMTQFPQDSVTVGHPITTSTRTDEAEAFESNQRVASAFLKLVSISVPAAILVFYFGVARRPIPVPMPTTAAVVPPAPTVPEQSEPATPVSPTTGSGTTVPVATSPKPEAPATTDPKTDPKGLLSVGLSAQERCWISITVDGQRAIQRELAAGESQAFDVRQAFAATVGNAGGLSMTLNGAATKPLGKTGQVVTVRFDMNNFRRYLAAP